LLTVLLIDATPNVEPKTLPNLPTAPDNLKTAWNLDTQFGRPWRRVEERFNAWIAQ
jgi:hypothetical protein